MTTTNHIYKLQVSKIQNPNIAYLMNEINKTSTMGFNVRGFALWDDHDQTVEISSDSQEPGPIWFVFNGMGSQWVGMGRCMLEIPIFKASIEKSANTLKKQVNFDLMKLIEEGDDDSFQQPTN